MDSHSLIYKLVVFIILNFPLGILSTKKMTPPTDKKVSSKPYSFCQIKVKPIYNHILSLEINKKSHRVRYTQNPESWPIINFQIQTQIKTLFFRSQRWKTDIHMQSLRGTPTPRHIRARDNLFQQSVRNLPHKQALDNVPKHIVKTVRHISLPARTSQSQLGRSDRLGRSSRKVSNAKPMYSGVLSRGWDVQRLP